LLKRISEFYKSNDELRKAFYFDGYDLWYCVQMLVFLDIKRFYGCKNKNREDCYLDAGRRKFPAVLLKDFAVFGFLLALSFAAFLKSLVSKKDAVVFSVDVRNSKYKSDKRIEYVYDFLNRENMRFVEVFHTVFGKKPLVNFLHRKRLAFYLEVFDFLHPLASVCRKNKFKGDIGFCGAFSDDEVEFVKRLFAKYADAVGFLKFKMRAFAFLFSLLKVKYIFMIDDTRYYFPIVYAGKKNNIKTIAFQHGHFTKYHVGWLDYLHGGDALKPDKLFVFSDYWKNELLRLGSYFESGDMEVFGYPHYAPTRAKKREGDFIGVLIPYETEAPKKEVLEYVKKIVACENVKLFFKLRTDIPKEAQIKEYFLSELRDKIVFVDDIAECAGKIDIVCGVYSSFLYDMIAYEKPVLLLKTSMDYGEGMVRNGLAEFLELSSDMCSVLRAVSRTDKKQTARRKNLLYSGGEFDFDALRSKIYNVSFS